VYAFRTLPGKKIEEKDTNKEPERSYRRVTWRMNMDAIML